MNRFALDKLNWRGSRSVEKLAGWDCTKKKSVAAGSVVSVSQVTCLSRQGLSGVLRNSMVGVCPALGSVW